MFGNLARENISVLRERGPEREREPRTIDENSVSQLLSTTTRARANMVESYYTQCFGNPCPPRAQREILCWLKDGIDENMLMEAMDEATMAPRPSWLYARAIVLRCINEGVKTVDAFYERQIRWQHGRR